MLFSNRVNQSFFWGKLRIAELCLTAHRGREYLLMEKAP